MADAGIEPELIGIGALARRVGYSASGLKKLEAAGIVPRARRIEGSDIRVWPITEVDAIRLRLDQRRAAGRRRRDPVRAA